MKQLNCKLYYRQMHLKYLCNLARYWLQAVWGWHDSVETCSSVIICEIIMHLVVTEQNNKKWPQMFDKAPSNVIVYKHSRELQLVHLSIFLFFLLFHLHVTCNLSPLPPPPNLPWNPTLFSNLLYLFPPGSIFSYIRSWFPSFLFAQ